MFLTPYNWIKEQRHTAALWIVFALMAVIALALGQLKPPGGWLALEFPVLSQSGSGPETWSTAQREIALFGLGVDFLFLLVYPLFLSLFLEQAGRSWELPALLARPSVAFSTLILLAAPLDALENIGLYLLIRGQSGPALQWFVTAVAAPKWIIALTASLLALACLGIWLYRKVTS